MEQTVFIILVNGVELNTSNSPLIINTLAQGLDIWGKENPNINGMFSNAKALSDAVRLQTALDLKFGDNCHFVQTKPVDCAVL